MTNEWLDLVYKCRRGYQHGYDIVEGPAVDDQIWDCFSNYLDGEISREAFWSLVKFKHPTNQISFHTIRALQCLKFKEYREVNRGNIR